MTTTLATIATVVSIATLTLVIADEISFRRSMRKTDALLRRLRNDEDGAQ